MKKRRNLTRALALLLTLVMLLCVVGCSKEENTTGKVEGSQNTGNKDTSGGDSSTTAPVEPTEPELYVIRGVWKLNDELVKPAPKDGQADASGAFDQEIEFMANGETFDHLQWRYWAVVNDEELNIASSIRRKMVYLYASLKGGWKTKDYMTLDFGDIPQEVSKEFYEWFTLNATQQ